MCAAERGNLAPASRSENGGCSTERGYEWSLVDMPCSRFSEAKTMIAKPTALGTRFESSLFRCMWTLLVNMARNHPETLLRLVFEVLACISWRVRIVCFTRLRHISIKDDARRGNACGSHIGGGKAPIRADTSMVRMYVSTDSVVYDDGDYVFLSHIREDEYMLAEQTDVVCRMPLSVVALNVPMTASRAILYQHSIVCGKGYVNRAELERLLSQHDCSSCHPFVTIFRLLTPKVRARDEAWNAHRFRPTFLFPPKPVTRETVIDIVGGFCQDSAPRQFEEAGCLVCGRLTNRTSLVSSHSIRRSIETLDVDAVTRKERVSPNDPIVGIPGPIVDPACTKVCRSCVDDLADGRMPKYALANGLWIGSVPPALSALRFAERLLVSRVRHNYCVARVAEGGRKLVANAVIFASPMPKIYDKLPPPRSDLDDVLAIIFSGPTRPNFRIMARTPFLVRRKAVTFALEWLKLNHSDYQRVHIDYDILDTYPEEGPPVPIQFWPMATNVILEGTGVHEFSDEVGTTEGDCLFTVHGLTGEDLAALTVDQITAVAVDHLNDDGMMLSVGHESKMESMYNNPQLYPQMFPWLFPYGLGGIGTTHLSEMEHIRFLLLHHDKRFQKDDHFVLIAFNHQQIKKSSKGGYLLVNDDRFAPVVKRITELDTSVLRDLIRKLERREPMPLPRSEAEKACFRVIHDLDLVGGKVDGSLSTKKVMRSEVWSLVAYKGPPTWYLTLSPADVRHPLSIYLSDTRETFFPNLYSKDDAARLVTGNPVAGARFFDFMVRLFIKHILGCVPGTGGRTGLYGPTAAYYGTVEQQGRLALHFHVLIWVEGSLSPSRIKDLIMDPESDFAHKLADYLDAAHQGQFITGSLADVSAAVKDNARKPSYVAPVDSMPVPPDYPCPLTCAQCEACVKSQAWFNDFDTTVDALLLRCNIHSCESNLNTDGKVKLNRSWNGCKNRYGECKSRFPRPIVLNTTVDRAEGRITVKKLETYMNSISPAVTYCFRCNTDTTCLLSGTAIKAVITYVTDYVTKPGLKTHVIFDTILTIFERNVEMLHGSLERNEKARRLMVKVINAVGVKLEIGAPMAAMFLLGNPDHYSSHTFVNFPWKLYVRRARSVFRDEKSEMIEEEPESVLIKNVRGKLVGSSPVHDYVYRPVEYGAMSLYDWVRLSRRSPLRSGGCSRVVDAEGQEEPNPNERDELDDAASESKRSRKLLEFLKPHPLMSTHGVLCVTKDTGRTVPNFTGGAVPRKDKGDTEYYSATMLAFFKPWRTGGDLRTKMQTWTDAFTSYAFKSRELEVMRNFNVQYECLDARDDFSSKLRAGGVQQEMFTHWDSRKQELDDQRRADHAAGLTLEYDDVSEDALMMQGSYYGEQATKAAEMMSRLYRAGWMAPEEYTFDPAHFGAEQFSALVGTDTKSGAKYWNSVVSSAKRQIKKNRLPQILSFTVPSKSVSSYVKFNTVKVVSKSYLDKSFTARTEEAQMATDEIVLEMGLNEEQERAFRIIANYASIESPSEPLLMYIGGMGGTGKTRVLSALSGYFKRRSQSHRFRIVAPTGSAAALLAGCTYHSVLKIRDQGGEHVTENMKAGVSQELKDVDFVIIDEISMVSSRELHTIATRMMLASEFKDKPFGKRSCIVAGDFAQLPPVIGKESASLYGEAGRFAATTLGGQEATLGKALWHQMVTVVILRTNMRQTVQSEADARFRVVLENMRYKACTIDDISFLSTMVAGKGSGRPDLSSSTFRHVGIITARNMHKDEINRFGSEQFARDTNQELSSFYSIDSLHSTTNRDRVKKGKRMKDSTASVISGALQEVLWNRPPSSSDKMVPGRLDLCLGMPVMIRKNEATELCITNGQEGTVAGWYWSEGPHGRPILDTLFIRLVNPPQKVELKGLPCNVVPVCRSKTFLVFRLPNSDVIHIKREQVEVALSFAMTDYASQGKTRIKNVVDLSECSSHQSYYTCLSRSSSAACTAILCPIKPAYITRGASGWLRQEFRHLEILDEVTRLKYEGTLPENFPLDRRAVIIAAYQQWKGTKHVPARVHRAIAWQSEDLVKNFDDLNWQLIKSDREAAATLKQSASSANDDILNTPLVRDTIQDVEFDETITNDDEGNESDGLPAVVPSGVMWDSVDYSCSYDAAITILLFLWRSDPVKWSRELGTMDARFMGILISGFSVLEQNGVTLENLRNLLRRELHIDYGRVFPYGTEGARVADIFRILCSARENVMVSPLICTVCRVRTSDDRPSREPIIYCFRERLLSTSEWTRDLSEDTAHMCPHCMCPMVYERKFVSPPPLLTLEADSYFDIPIDYEVQIDVWGELLTYTLCGVVYYGDFHFTSRLVSSSREIWFHDGRTTGAVAEVEKRLSSSELLICKGRRAMCAVYSSTETES